MTTTSRPARSGAEWAAAGAAALVAGGCSRLAGRRLDGSVAGRSTGLAVDHWVRTNHAGHPVTLLEGPALLAGVAAGSLVRLALRPGRGTAAVAIAVLGAGLVGAYDDRYGTAQAKGFRGHLRALSEGRLTSGTIKIVGVGTAGLLGAVVSRRKQQSGVDVVLTTTLTAAAANLVNLLDLRPGRAIKAGLLLGAATLGSGSAPVLAAAAAVLPDDLAGRSMLGDCGANALGAGVGAATAGWSRPARATMLLLLAGLNLASERVSFTQVIERTPLLRALDRLGRPG